MLLPFGKDRYIYMSEETGDNSDIETLRDNMATDLGLINALQRDFKDTVRSWEWCRDMKKKNNNPRTNHICNAVSI